VPGVYARKVETAVQQTFWVAAGEEQARATLARMLGAPAHTGPPQLEAFPSPAPAAIVLHVPAAHAREAVHFAQLAAAQHPRAQLLLAADPELDPIWLSTALAGLRATRIAWPPDPQALQAALRRALAGAAPSSAARRQRDALVARVTRTLGDIALPELERAASGHLTITGERGTGKLLLARTLHAIWDEAEDARASFVLLAGDPGATAAQLEARLAEAASRSQRVAICVAEPAAFSHSLQRELASWVELGVSGAPVSPLDLFWIFLRTEALGALAPLDGALAEICEAPALRIAPLREREGAAVHLAEEWLRESGTPRRALAPSAREAIARDPWPGNARELEAALRRALRTPGAEPLEAEAFGLASAPAREPRDELGAAAEIASRVREFTSVSDELEAARGSEASERSAPPRRGLEVVFDVHGISEAGSDLEKATPAVSAPPISLPSDSLPSDSAPPRTPEASALTAEQRAEIERAARSEALRALARAAAHEIAAALPVLRARDEPSAARLARRLARLEAFAQLELAAAERAAVAPVLGALLEERQRELRAKRILALRGLEDALPLACGSETALRFAFGALFDGLLEATPDRASLYLAASAREGRIEVLLRASGASALAEDALDVVLARDVLARLGAELHCSETEDRQREVKVVLESC
jgi:hypothetical protein